MWQADWILCSIKNPRIKGVLTYANKSFPLFQNVLRGYFNHSSKHTCVKWLFYLARILKELYLLNLFLLIFFIFIQIVLLISVFLLLIVILGFRKAILNTSIIRIRMMSLFLVELFRIIVTSKAHNVLKKLITFQLKYGAFHLGCLASVHKISNW